MSHRQKHKHRARHHTHAVKPTNLPKRDMALIVPPAAALDSSLQSENVQVADKEETDVSAPTAQ